MKRNWITVISVTLFAAIFIIGCEVTSNIQTADLITAEDDAIADAAYDDVFSEVDAVMNLMDQFGYKVAGLKSGMEGLDTCPVPSGQEPLLWIMVTDAAWMPPLAMLKKGSARVR